MAAPDRVVLAAFRLWVWSLFRGYTEEERVANPEYREITAALQEWEASFKGKK